MGSGDNDHHPNNKNSSRSDMEMGSTEPDDGSGEMAASNGPELTINNPNPNHHHCHDEEEEEYNEDDENEEEKEENLLLLKPWLHAKRIWVILAVVLGVGIVASAMMLTLGLRSAKHDQRMLFDRLASSLFLEFELALSDYVDAGAWLHEACRENQQTHHQFRITYEYVLSTGLEFQAVSYAMNVTQAQRASIENKTRAYLIEQEQQQNQNGTNSNSSTAAAAAASSYVGFTGFEMDLETGEYARVPRSYHPWYMPIHLVEPMDDAKNLAALDFDICTSGVRRQAVEQALDTRLPAMTERVKLIRETEVGTEAYAFSVIMMHPGIPLVASSDVSVMAIRIPDLMQRALDAFTMKEDRVEVYLYDTTDFHRNNHYHNHNYHHSHNEEDNEDALYEPPFLGGVVLKTRQGNNNHNKNVNLTFTQERNFTSLHRQDQHFLLEKHFSIASRDWLFVVKSSPGTFESDITFVIFSAVSVLVACISLALWLYTSSRRDAKMSQMRAQAKAEKAKIRIESARNAAKAERELNDFIAHEVRNPVAAAISACSFISESVHEEQPLVDEASKLAVREDVGIIESSLSFINELLRSMLDMHRAASKRLKIDMSHVDILRDVMDPVRLMLYKRGSNFDVIVDCPQHLIVTSDPLRLKQTILNLGRNATKFVEKGFIRLTATVEHDTVLLSVEDSGPGIPMEKRKHLFAKFQESLDSLNQGTGIGLSLCRSLVELMEGEIWLDENYVSGVEGCPGTRFVIDLKTAPLQVDALESDGNNDEDDDDEEQGRQGKKSEQHDDHHDQTNSTTATEHLPEKLSVLFVDDTFVLRKLFARSVKRVREGWVIQEAASGEAALDLVSKQHFDVIFMDQYMASVDKQLLGTETVRALRARGFTATICGLSANDLEQSFLSAGADTFVMKPFPCEKDELTAELLRVLQSRERA